MPNKPLRPCSRPGCPNLVSKGLCEDHKRQSNRDYDRGRKDDPGRKLIQSGRWRKIRSRKLSINPLCERCERAGRLIVATMVHHRDRNQLNNKDNLNRYVIPVMNWNIKAKGGDDETINKETTQGIS